MAGSSSSISCGSPRVSGPNRKGVAGGIFDGIVALSTAGRDAELAWRRHLGQEGREIVMLPDVGELAVVQPGAAQALVVEVETQRVDQVQAAAGVGHRRMILPVLGGISG